MLVCFMFYLCTVAVVEVLGSLSHQESHMDEDMFGSLLSPNSTGRPWIMMGFAFYWVFSYVKVLWKFKNGVIRVLKFPMSFKVTSVLYLKYKSR